MKLFFGLVFLALSFTTMADSKKPQLCLSHGACQQLNSLEDGVRCFKQAIGVDHWGEEICTVRCYQITFGYTCNKLEGRSYGVCEKESFKIPHIDHDNPDCSDAIDYSVIDGLIR